MEIFYYFFIIRWVCENYMLIEFGKYLVNIILWKFKIKKSVCYFELCYVGRSNDLYIGFCEFFFWWFLEEKRRRGGGREGVIVGRKYIIMFYVLFYNFIRYFIYKF